MTALPPVDPGQIGNLEPNALSAYNVCLDFERDTKTVNDAIRARVLGYLILHAPSLHARYEVIKMIHSCAQKYDALSELGQSFIDYFIRPFKKLKRRTPVSESNPSRPSLNRDKMDLMVEIQEAPRDPKTAKAQALIRDGFRCVVTGKYDMQAENVPGIDEEDLLRTGAVFTEYAYIVPQSTYFDVFTCTDSHEKKADSTPVLAVLKHFGYGVDSLNGPKVHSLCNVMTMQYDPRYMFDRLHLWFEATEVAHCYRVMTIHKFFHVPEKITLTSPNPTTLPIPSPELIAMHAACAKVAHLSGAGAYIDKLDRDVDDLDVDDPLSQRWGNKGENFLFMVVEMIELSMRRKAPYTVYIQSVHCFRVRSVSQTKTSATHLIVSFTPLSLEARTPSILRLPHPLCLHLQPVLVPWHRPRSCSHCAPRPAVRLPGRTSSRAGAPPGGDATHYVVNTDFCPGQKYAILVNTSRGTLVDSDALALALREEWIWGAGFDVVEGEPHIDADHPLVKEPKSGCSFL